jgi:hypothetical protein
MMSAAKLHRGSRATDQREWVAGLPQQIARLVITARGARW